MVESGEKDIDVGDALAVLVFEKKDIAAFEKYSDIKGEEIKVTQNIEISNNNTSVSDNNNASIQSNNTNSNSSNRIIASPLAKIFANSQGVNLNEIGKGSGDNGRIIKSDVEEFAKSFLY